MNSFLNKVNTVALLLVNEEDGAQVIEYALIIAVISIALVLGLKGLDGQFSNFVDRVVACLTGGTCT